MGTESNHSHKWEVFKAPDKLHCPMCTTVTDIDTLLLNTELSAALQSKIDVLTKQLYNRELKKEAHDVAYAFVTRSAPMSVQMINQSKQEGLAL